MSEQMTKYRRYPGVQPFKTEQADLFFGRDDDRERLLNLLLLEKLLVLFGKSGYGKSSLLNAGIIPDLDDENPIKYRYLFAAKPSAKLRGLSSH